MMTFLRLLIGALMFGFCVWYTTNFERRVSARGLAGINPVEWLLVAAGLASIFWWIVKLL